MLVYNRSLHYGDCNKRHFFLVVAVASSRFLIFVLKFRFCYLCHPFQVHNRCHPSLSSHAHLPGLLALVFALHDARSYLSIIENIRSVSIFELLSSLFCFRNSFVFFYYKSGRKLRAWKFSPGGVFLNLSICAFTRPDLCPVIQILVLRLYIII